VLSYAVNVRDRTGDWATQLPAHVIVVDRNTPPMSYRGYWGKDESITVVNFRHPPLPIEVNGAAPNTPPLHALWSHPLATIFHNPSWHRG
jgi:hypothetical protein